jgi:hypothetical protein
VTDTGHLSAQLQALETAIAGTRREALAGRMDEIRALIAAARQALADDTAALQAAEQAYRARYGWLLRVTPLAGGRRHYREHVRPRWRDVARSRELELRGYKLMQANAAAAGWVEWRTKVHGGVAGLYHPVTGRAEWRTKVDGGVAGVYHPGTGRIEWRDAARAGVAGAFNPVTGEIEWRTTFGGGVCGVWNPRTREIEWRDAAGAGVAGVWNPRTQEVEWRDAAGAGVAGAFNPATGAVEWSRRFGCGVACLAFDGTTYVSSASYYGGDDGLSSGPRGARSPG